MRLFLLAALAACGTRSYPCPEPPLSGPVPRECVALPVQILDVSVRDSATRAPIAIATVRVEDVVMGPLRENESPARTSLLTNHEGLAHFELPAMDGTAWHVFSIEARDHEPLSPAYDDPGPTYEYWLVQR